MKFISMIAILALICVSVSANDAGRKKIKISSADFNNKYSVTGPLGPELGTVVVLEVEKVRKNTKENPSTLKVLSVNGKKLEKPVNFPYHMLIINDTFDFDRKYRIKAYQDGSFTGTPDAVLKDVMFQTKGYYFEVSLIVYQIIK